MVSPLTSYLENPQQFTFCYSVPLIPRQVFKEKLNGEWTNYGWEEQPENQKHHWLTSKNLEKDTQLIIEAYGDA